ncbi:hypothetical protein JAO78_005255 [Alishewanella sp. 16-MA]|uniref:Uncharacterized protein n=1 Tax=Alishewanella maricola TaxID=2795740 RepID=A0ABS8C1N0_9ALTE|nr:hypothetical protein [Alishewanella maricola]MCB5226219.1 hypothetical protein [Alishewanella maricola]
MAAIPKIWLNKFHSDSAPNYMRYGLMRGGVAYVPWWGADSININHADGSRIVGAELRTATMLEF